MLDCWKLKKSLAENSEPACVDEFYQIVKDRLYGRCHWRSCRSMCALIFLGYTLAGAGGGGFLVCVTKEKNISAEIEEEIGGTSLASFLTFRTGAATL